MLFAESRYIRNGSGKCNDGASGGQTGSMAYVYLTTDSYTSTVSELWMAVVRSWFPDSE
jgi:hypothetical protein